jgi:biopolymer transport protein TolQ
VILAQLTAAVPSSPIELILASSGVTLAVLAVLAVLSLLSWAVMLSKWRTFRVVERTGREFHAEFSGCRSFGEAEGLLLARGEEGAHPRILQRAVRFLDDLRTGAAGHRSDALSASQVEALRLVLDAETNAERDRLGTYIPFLAMVGSVSPLLGLLGTVLGVISAFLGVARGGSGNLAAVAPGVAEALVATAFALAVAIPAYFGYNIFAARLNRLDGELDAFGTEVIALIAREGRL